MRDIILKAWTLEIRIVPIILAIGLSEGISWIRRLIRAPYTPIYVSFLLSSLNTDLSLYFGQDVNGRGLELNNESVIEIRRRIVRLALVSTLLSAALLPLLIGGLLAFFLNWDVFVQYLVAITLYRSWQAYSGYRDFRYHAFATARARRLLASVYLIFIFVVARLTYDGYLWARPFAAVGDFGAMFNALTRLIVSTGIGYAIIATLLATLFASWITTPKLRQDQIDYIRQAHFGVEASPELLDKDWEEGPGHPGNSGS